MDCSDIENWLSSQYDNELSDDLRIDVELHLQNCEACRAKLDDFRNLSSLTRGFLLKKAPPGIWSEIKTGLKSEHQMPHSDASLAAKPKSDRQDFGERVIQIARLILAMLVIGLIGSMLWFGDHGHDEMAHVIEQVVAQIDSEESLTLLQKEFGGRETSIEEVRALVGYRPVAGYGLPNGYSVENVQVLEMPCCECTQTACQRPDNSRFFIYEHEEADTGWFDRRESRHLQCQGKPCEIFQFKNNLAATWKTSERHYITLLGIHDDKEIELLVEKFEDHS